MKTLTFWFFRGNLVESTCPPIQKQQSETVIHFELQYVLGTPLAANQQPAISTERNATSLHRIENQCASNERFTEVGTFAAVMWSSLLLGRLFEPKARNNNHRFGSTFSIPNTHGFRKMYRYDSIKEENKNQQGQHWQQNCNTLVTNCVTSNLCKVYGRLNRSMRSWSKVYA